MNGEHAQAGTTPNEATPLPDPGPSRDMGNDMRNDLPGDAPHDAPSVAPSPENGVGVLHQRLAQAMERGDLGAGGGSAGSGWTSLLSAPVTLRAVLGEARVPVSRFLSLDAGDTLTLDRAVGEPIDVTVNDAIVARGEIVMLDEEAGTLGVRITALADT